MQIPLQIAFHQIDHSETIEREVQRRAVQLERYFSRITSVRVLIEPSAGPHRARNLFKVRVDMTLPGHEIVVEKDPLEQHSHEDSFVAIRDAFLVARRKLEDYVRSHFRDRNRTLKRELLRSYQNVA